MSSKYCGIAPSNFNFGLKQVGSFRFWPRQAAGEGGSSELRANVEISEF